MSCPLLSLIQFNLSLLRLILEDHWKRNPALHTIPIYHNAKVLSFLSLTRKQNISINTIQVATKALEVYRTYINVMNESIRKENRKRNPWKFDFIYPLHTRLKSQKGIRIACIISHDVKFVGIAPSVILASPGMLQNGPSREIFETMCSDERNALVLAGTTYTRDYDTLPHKTK